MVGEGEMVGESAPFRVFVCKINRIENNKQISPSLINAWIKIRTANNKADKSGHWSILGFLTIFFVVYYFKTWNVREVSNSVNAL